MFSIKSPENQVNCIYGVIRPLYIGTRLIGFFPFSVKIQLNGKHSKAYFTLIDFIVFVVHIIVYGFFAYQNIQHNYLENPAAAPLLILGTRTLLVLGIINGILCISADLCNRHKIFNLLIQCHNFDVQVIVLSYDFDIKINLLSFIMLELIQMKALGSHSNYKRCKSLVHLQIVSCMAISLVFFTISLWIYYSQYALDVLVFIFPSYLILNFTFGSVMSIYCFFVFSVKTRYYLLNENFRFVTLK